jgi:uncharacterized protein YjiK
MVFCKPASEKVAESPPGYNFSSPIKFWMPLKLDEISGISIYNDCLYAIQDEQGRLYHFRLDSDKIKSTKFGSKADYEDLAILDSTLFILESNGSIYFFPLAFADSAEADDIQSWTVFSIQCEYEGLYADSRTNRLYILSKECKNDKTTQKRAGIIMEWKNDSLEWIDSFSIDIELLKKIKGNKKVKFKPSAIAMHPITHQWYILSSTDKLLLITDEKFIPRFTFKLKESFLSQPEGICFDAVGNLYIASEKGNAFEGKIFKFEIKQ